VSDSDPSGAHLPAAFVTEHARLKLEAESAQAKMRRLDWVRFAIWMAASIVLIIALLTPVDTTGWWLVLALGACFTAHSMMAAKWNTALSRFSRVMFETQWLAAGAMVEAHKRGEFDIRD
jgi:hypothetical protein